MKKATIKDIAKEAGVSIATVSYVINNTQGKIITGETKQKVIDAAQKLDYVVDSRARAMRMGNSMNIGLVFFWDMSSYGFIDMFEPISRTASEYDYNILFYAPAGIGDELGYIDLYRRKLVDGIILISPVEYYNDFDEEKHIEAIKIMNIPAVILRGHTCDNELNYIQFDFFDASYKATNYLISLNHKKIGYLLPNEDEMKQSQAMQRLQGYKTAMSENRLSLNMNYIVYPKDYQKLCDSILTGNGPSAIVASKSEYAYEIMCTMNEKSIKIPDDVSIIACNNMPYNSFLFPPLTGIQLPYGEMGKSSVEILITSIKNGSVNVNIKSPNKIIERKSCRKL